MGVALGLHRAGVRQWLPAVAVPTAVMLAAFALLWIAGPARPVVPEAIAGFRTGPGFWALFPLILVASLVTNTLTNSLGEELGWRGYLLPRLTSLGRQRAADRARLRPRGGVGGEATEARGRGRGAAPGRVGRRPRHPGSPSSLSAPTALSTGVTVRPAPEGAGRVVTATGAAVVSGGAASPAPRRHASSRSAYAFIASRTKRAVPSPWAS